MIKYNLTCKCGKVFESWFSSSLEFDSLYKKKLIKDTLKDPDVSKAIRNYSRSKDENQWIPRAISWKFHKLLEFACNKRAKEILSIRRSRKSI